MPQIVHLERSGAVAVVTIDRPQALNALTDQAKDELLTAVQSVRDDPTARALVLTGSGRAFCVGQDLREHAAGLESAGLGSSSPAPLSTVREHFNPLITMLSEFPVPTVAALNGTTAGAGLGIACAMDLRVGAAGSSYTTAFAGIGLSVDSGLSWTLPRLVGQGRALALLLLAEAFTSEQALEMGLLNAVVAPDLVLPTALELATRLAAGPTAAYAAIKQAVGYAAGSTLVEALAREDDLQTVAGATADHVGAVRSFLAKQPPVFRGV